MGKRKQERERIVAIIDRYIDDLHAGRQVGHWDVPHKPTEAEQRGRIAMLAALAREVERGHKEAEGSE